MRISLSACLAAAMFALLPAGGAHAAVETVPAVLSSCPIEARVGTCGNAVIDFLNGQPDDQRDAGIAELVAALAEAARNPGISPYMCAELEEAIRIAGGAASSAAAQQEIQAIADALCEGRRLPDRIVTGSINGPNANGGDGPPQSIIDPIGDPPPPPTDSTPPADPGPGPGKDPLEGCSLCD